MKDYDFDIGIMGGGAAGLTPWCTYTNPELASAAGVEYSVWAEAFKDNDRSLVEGEKIGKIKRKNQ